MHIQLETPDNNTIRAYTDKQITVAEIEYHQSVIISGGCIIPEWPVQSVPLLNEKNLKPLLHLNPEIIIIGHDEPGVYIPMAVIQYLSKQRIGIECMSIGAACRTFNVLLSEARKVVLGIIFNH